MTSLIVSGYAEKNTGRCVGFDPSLRLESATVLFLRFSIQRLFVSRRLFTGSNLDETFLCIFQFHAENNASISLARRHPKPYPPTPSPGPAE